MIRTQIYLPKDLKLQLAIYAQNQNIPISEVVRRSVFNEINKKRNKIKNSTLSVISKMAIPGPRDLSVHLFDYLYGKKSDYASKK